MEFYFIGEGGVTKIYQENSSLIDIKIMGTLLDNVQVHAFRLILFTNITMVASVAKVIDGTSDFLVMMVTLITKLPVLQWLPLLSLLPRLLAAMVMRKRHMFSCCVCIFLCYISISTCIDIQGKWLKQGLVYTRVLDGPIYNVQFSEKYVFRMCLSFCSVIR